jgi:hypothetical protein
MLRPRSSDAGVTGAFVAVACDVSGPLACDEHAIAAASIPAAAPIIHICLFMMT